MENKSKDNQIEADVRDGKFLYIPLTYQHGGAFLVYNLEEVDKVSQPRFHTSMKSAAPKDFKDKIHRLHLDIIFALTHCFGNHNGTNNQPVPSYSELLKERDALKKDAERYRWLKEGGFSHSTDLDVVDIEGSVLTMEYLDEAIDSEMEGQK